MESSESNSINQIDKQGIDFTGSLISTSSSFSISDNVLEGGIKSALNIGNVVIGNGQWIVDDETTQESLISSVKANVDGRMNSLFDQLRDRLPLNDVEEESTGNPFTEENPFAEGENPFGDEEFTPPQGYENSPLPSQDIVDDIKSVQDSETDDSVVEDFNPIVESETDNSVVEDFNPIVESETDNSVIEDSNPTEESETDNSVVEDSNPTEESETDNSVVHSGENSFAGGGENPFAGGEGGENPFAGGEGGNPFAGGEGGNPFAGGSENPFAGGEGGENPFAGGEGGENPFAGGEGDGNPFAGGEGDGNPFAGGEGGENPFAGGEGGNPIAENDNGDSSPSFDMLGMIFGEDLPFLNASEGDDGYSTIPSQSTNETLKGVRNSLLIFNAKLSSSDTFGEGNDTPLQTPNDLLTLFRNDMFQLQ